MSILSEFFKGAARALTVPAKDRDALHAALQQNPQALAQVNALKQSVTLGAIHAIAGEHSDPLTAALASAEIAQFVERAIPTPPTPETGVQANVAPLQALPDLRMPSIPLQTQPIPPTQAGTVQP